MGLECDMYGRQRGAYRVLVGKPEVKRQLSRPKRIWEYNIKTDLQKVGWGMNLIDLVQDRDGLLWMP